MSEKESAIFKSLLKGGVIGTTLSSLLYKDKGQDAALGAIAGAALLASVTANENAQKTQIPMVVEEDRSIYKVYSDGTKKLIKHLPTANTSLPKKFTLK